MKSKEIKLYLTKIAFIQKSAYFLFFAILLAIFCLPKFSSLAYYTVDAGDYLQKIQHIVSLNHKTKTEILKLYVTAYSSTLEQTDSTPCIAASGYDLCKHNKENVVACNFLPYGTKVIFPDLDPEKVYIVVDRMHERYNSRLDIWMKDTAAAKKFGLKYLRVAIIRDN